MDYAWYLFSFEGRINRARYWQATLIILCWMIFLAGLTISLVVLLGGTGPINVGFGVDDLFKIFDPASYLSLSLADLPGIFFKTAFSVLVVWVYVATSIKRLHDRDKSGWWMVRFSSFQSSTTSSSTCFLTILISRMSSFRLASPPSLPASGASSNCTSSRAHGKPTGSGLTHWRRAIRGRAGISRARSKWCRTRLMPTFRSSRSLAATTFRELRKAMGISRFTVLVPLFDLKSLAELAACAVGTSNRRH